MTTPDTANATPVDMAPSAGGAAPQKPTVSKDTATPDMSPDQLQQILSIYGTQR